MYSEMSPKSPCFNRMGELVYTNVLSQFCFEVVFHGDLKFIEGKMDGSMYSQILGDIFLPVAYSKFGNHFLLQDNNESKHQALISIGDMLED